MKDAKGHGSEPRGGAAHQVGVEQATVPSFLPVVQGSGKDRNYYVQHGPTKSWLGSTLMFKKQQEAESFVKDHLDPTNPWWRDAPNLMSTVYAKAQGEFHKRKK